MTAKEKILGLLERCRDRYLSGEEIAGQLGLSRSAVWKAVNSLRSEGYGIEAVTNRGYRLRADSDIYSEGGLDPFLLPEVKRDLIHIYQTVRSTSRTARELAVSDAPHGSVVLADCQTEGVARGSGRFFSPSGGIYISFILKPPVFPFEEDTVLSAFGAVCAGNAIGMTSGICPAVTHVNDLELNGRKICGIMTEVLRDAESGSTEWIVMGIGIHFRLMDRDLPPELRDRFSSLYPDGHPQILRNYLTAELMNEVLVRGPAMTGEEILRLYRSRKS